MDKEILKEAINSGVDAEAVNSTLNDMISKIDEKGRVPRQVKPVIATIVHMKKGVDNVPDKTYASNFVRQNSERIKAAINDGISPNEIATTLLESTEKANDRMTKRRLKFITKLIVKMKRKELALRLKNEREMEKGRQKIFVNNASK